MKRKMYFTLTQTKTGHPSEFTGARYVTHTNTAQFQKEIAKDYQLPLHAVRVECIIEVK